MSKKRTAKPRIPPKALREVWEKVPGMKDCKGLCFDSCGPIPVSSLERSLLEERTGKELRVADGPGLDCVLLQNGLCSAYSIRPLVCRIWGVAEGLPCTHGCEPERVLSAEEALALFKEIEEIAGDDADRAMRDMIEAMTPSQRSAWRSTHNAEVRKVAGRIMNGRRGFDQDG